MQITGDQLVEISKAGFPKHIKQHINFDNCRMSKLGGVFRLYDKSEMFKGSFPISCYLILMVGENNFFQFDSGIRAFNQYSAFKKMEEMGLINFSDKKLNNEKSNF